MCRRAGAKDRQGEEDRLVPHPGLVPNPSCELDWQGAFYLTSHILSGSSFEADGQEGTEPGFSIDFGAWGSIILVSVSLPTESGGSPRGASDGRVKFLLKIITIILVLIH